MNERMILIIENIQKVKILNNYNKRPGGMASRKIGWATIY